MNKIIINFAIVSCFALGATFAHAEHSESDEGSGSTQKVATTRYNYYKTSDVHGKKQRVPGAQSEGVIHPSEPMKQEELKIEQSDPHSLVDGA